MLLFLYIKDENGNKMVNQYVHLGKIGSGSYGKVVRYLGYVDIKFSKCMSKFLLLCCWTGYVQKH